ncbi:MAG: ribosome small subunit-dependent GTPase A [Candidatus Cloacimonetes bacterium]|jgi:ribosome biogenesis GTPase|nr:ribosome small subunit-dependent GTPase A [Candidatus Cloacimonadota bacterium]
MNKKREKKKFKRKNIKISNIELTDIDHFTDDEISEEKRAEKKLIEKGKTSNKRNLKLERGRILEVRSNYKCLVKIGDKELFCTLGGRFKQVNFETKSIITAGDYVNVDVSGDSRIEEIIDRTNTLSRFSDNDFQIEIIIASNIDQVIITSSYKDPQLNLGLIDRYICAAKISNITPVICINKIDLAESLKEIKQTGSFYEKLGFQVIYTSIKKGEGITELKELLKDKDSVFSGHSGAGKSSLINKLQPDLKLRTAEISDYHRKGIHTTTRSRLLEWDFGGYLVDTPGIKTFGLHRNDKEKIPGIFPGLSVLTGECKFFNCTHSHEMECGIKKAVENGSYPVERYESYLRILESL